MIFRKDVFFLRQKRRKNIEKKIGLVSEIMDVPETNLKKLRGFVDTHERPKFVPICWHTRKTEICPDLLAHTKDRNLSQFEEMHTSSRKIKVHTSSRKLQIPDPIKLRAEPSN